MCQCSEMPLWRLINTALASCSCPLKLTAHSAGSQAHRSLNKDWDCSSPGAPMLCKNHSSAICRSVQPQGMEREHVEQRMIQISHRIGEVFPSAFIFLFTKILFPHDLVFSLAISHHCITNEMTLGAVVTSCTQSLSWHIWIRRSTTICCFQQISQLNVSPAAGLALIHGDLSNCTSQGCQWVFLMPSAILVVRRAGSASGVAVCSALLRGSMSQRGSSAGPAAGLSLGKLSRSSAICVHALPPHPGPEEGDSDGKKALPFWSQQWQSQREGIPRCDFWSFESR